MEARLPTYTVSVVSDSTLTPRLEQMLDVLPAAALVGGEGYPDATLWFDVRAWTPEGAVEVAYARIHGMIRDYEGPLLVEVVASSRVEGRVPLWRRLLRRR